LSRARLTAVAAGALLAAATAAWSHSLLLASTPAVGATVAASPSRLSLTFNGRIEKRLSRVRVVDGRGQARALAPETGGAPERLDADLPALPPGAYHVEWQVLSADGHVVSGRFAFRVSP